MTKQLVQMSLVALLGAAGYGVALRASAAPTTAPSTQPVNKMCAVEQEDAVDPSVTVQYQGKTIGFCCGSCVKKFQKDPEKYMKTLK